MPARDPQSHALRPVYLQALARVGALAGDLGRAVPPTRTLEGQLGLALLGGAGGILHAEDGVEQRLAVLRADGVGHGGTASGDYGNDGSRHVDPPKNQRG